MWPTDNWSSSFGESISNRTRSHSYSTASGCFHAGSSYSLAPFNDVFSPGRKLSHANPLQTYSAVPAAESLAPSRRESNCTCTSAVDVAVVPWIFKNALHAAVQSNAVDVLALLLDIGIDPNRTGTGSSTDTVFLNLQSIAVRPRKFPRTCSSLKILSIVTSQGPVAPRTLFHAINVGVRDTF